MKTLSRITAVLFLLYAGILSAQTKGSFDTTITFMGESRKISCFIPSDYNPAQKYRIMVGLHGLGDNSTNFRNGVIGSLKWQTLMTNTLFFFPDGGSDQNKDFYAPAGDEEIIQATIDLASAAYSVDMNEIILEGFSLGGRSALKYGLDHPGKFKGLFLNTPALQGLADLQNKPLTGLGYNYANSKGLPVYMTVGENDVAYYYTLELLADTLKKNEAGLFYEVMPGVGHVLPATFVAGKGYEFLDNPVKQNYDVDLFEITVPAYSCTKGFNAICHVQNLGQATVTSIKFSIKGSVITSFTWNGQLEAHGHQAVSVPLQAKGTDAQTIEISIDKINSVEDDPNTGNNRQESVVKVKPDQGIGVHEEGFENESPSWEIQRTGSLFEWFRDTDHKRSGTASMAVFNSILLFNTNGYVESFSSPYMDISALPKKTVSFDYAFNYHKYTPPYITPERVFADTLEIAISTDCGQSFSRLFYKGGADLATIDEPMLNPLSLPACFFDPGDDNWKREIIDLSAFSDEKNAMIRFNYISAMGGSLYIDNISAGTIGVGLEAVHEEVDFTAYPNPANDQLYVNLKDNGKATVRILDQTGKEVLTANIASQQGEGIDISGLSAGLYMLSVESGTKTGHRKLIVR